MTPARQPAARGGERIGLLGGSFDPVHNAHLALARSATRALSLDAVLWIPTGNAWQKARTLTPAAHRIAMLRLAIDGDEGRQRIDTCEVDRAGPSYMIDTVTALQAREPAARWWLLLGQDQLANLPTWHRWRELVSRLALGVANRAGEAPRLPPDLQSSGVTVAEVPLAPLAISSTDVRARVAAGQGIASLVPAAVARYIAEHGLYRTPHRS